VRLSELLGAEVRTESGERLGHVQDVRAELTTRTLKLTGLAVGGLGVLERLGLGAPGSRGRTSGRDVVSWGAVVRVDRGGVVVKDGTTPGRS
jgi:sporulation protein YlmC with PRC-barrel domain